MKIKKQYMALAAFFCAVSLIVPTPAQGAMTAKPTTSTVYVNGEKVECAAYYINGNNYFKLRDLAYALQDTPQAFRVDWDEDRHVVMLTSGEAYEPVGGEMEPVKNEVRSASISASTILVDGQTVRVQGYNIDGSTYFKLRDITNIFSISVVWNGKNNTINIETGQGEHKERVLTAKEIYDRCNNAIFYIATYDIDGDPLSSGSGFFLSQEGKAVTNFHVLKNAYSAMITLPDGNRFPVKGILGYDISGDIALLQVDGSGFPYLTLGDSDALTSGEKIYAIGSPMGLANTISEGIVSGINRTIGNIPYIQITAALSHGSSGGALLDEQGRAVGITSAGLSEGQNLNFAIPINAISTLETGDLIEFKTLVEIYALEEYKNRPYPFQNVVAEEEPNNITEHSQYIENGDSVVGILETDALDNYYAFCGTKGVLEIYCYSDAEHFEKVALLAEDMYGQSEAIGTFEELDDGEKGLYLIMPVPQPGYYHFALGAVEEGLEKDDAMEYVFYYQFTPDEATK